MNFPVIAWIIVSVFGANTLLQLEQILLFVGRGVYSNICAVSFRKVYELQPQTYPAVKLINSGCLCGNKMPTRCNRCFLLQILLLAQHVSGAIMPIIRSPRVFYSWLLPVAFGALVFKLSVWCGAEGCVSGVSAPHHPDNLETKAPNATGSNQL